MNCWIASDLVVDSNGVKWIRKARQKTKIMCNIPLREIPLKILEKYSDEKHCLVYDVLLPVMCNQKVNVHLKELVDICGIDKTLTTHIARYTFATYSLFLEKQYVCMSRPIPPVYIL